MRWFGNTSSRRSVSARPRLELLEDRVVPSGTPLDLSTRDASGEVGDAVFRQATVGPAGTGNLRSFLRIQGHGRDGRIEEGYNTDARPLEFDEKRNRRSTRSLDLSNVATVNIGGELYREFLLDINEPRARDKALLSLDELRLYMSDDPALTGYDAETGQLAGLDPIFDLDGVEDRFVVLNARLSSGSGRADALVYVKDSLFSEGGEESHVYLYSKFGEEHAAQGGFEEWAARPQPYTRGLGSIAGAVFDDTDGSGTLNDGEPGLVGWTVYLDANENGELDDSEVSTTTDDQGRYTFTNLATGLGDLSTYLVLEVVADGYEQTSDDPLPVALTEPGQTVEDVNFGNVLTPP